MRKTVTIVFTDVIDSTPLGEQLDAETYRRVISRYFIEVSRVLEHHGGTVEKFIGDAVMAAFGIRSCTRTTPCEPFAPQASSAKLSPH